jgi:hypothetical protein
MKHGQEVLREVKKLFKTPMQKLYLTCPTMLNFNVFEIFKQCAQKRFCLSQDVIGGVGIIEYADL